jgi:predicted nucleic acid-binding protein
MPMGATREPVNISREEILEALDAVRAERDDRIADALGERSPMPVVLGSSALVELLLQSERAPAVLQAVGTTDMVAPDGVNPEVLSTLRRLERNGKLPAERASQAVEDLLDADVRRFSTLTLLPAVWEVRAAPTACDGCAVALARALGCPLVTGDLRLSRASRLGVPLVAV